MSKNTFFSTFVKEVSSEEELKKRLKEKASNLKIGESAQFFINGEPRYLVKQTNNKFKIQTNPAPAN